MVSVLGAPQTKDYTTIAVLRAGIQNFPHFRAVSFHPVPLAMARVVFLARKKIDAGFQSNATFLFSNVSERPEKLIILSLPASTGKERLIKF